MPRVTVSLEFESAADAAAYLGQNLPKASVRSTGAHTCEEKHHAAQTVTHEELKTAGYEPKTNAEGHKAAANPQPVPDPQPAAPAGKTATSDECNKAFAAHAQKGGGRSAKTARDAIVKVIPHFSSFKALTPEECAKAVEAMEAA